MIGEVWKGVSNRAGGIQSCRVKGVEIWPYILLHTIIAISILHKLTLVALVDLSSSLNKTS